MTQIAVIDYGMGNLHSVSKALEAVSQKEKIVITSDQEVIKTSDKLVFPGVGAIKDCMEAFSNDLKTMYFTRNNYTDGRLASDRNRKVRLKLYSATSDDGESWSNIKELPFNSDQYSVAHPTLSKDGKRLYFLSN